MTQNETRGMNVIAHEVKIAETDKFVWERKIVGTVGNFVLTMADESEPWMVVVYEWACWANDERTASWYRELTEINHRALTLLAANAAVAVERSLNE